MCRNATSVPWGHATCAGRLASHHNCATNTTLLYRVTVDMRQHCTDGSFRFCRWRTHTEAFIEDSGPEALSTQGQYFALQGFYAILQPIAGELSANCCRTMTMTRYRFSPFCSRSWSLADSHARPGARGGLRSHCDRACRVGGSNAARGSPATSTRTVARRRATRPGLWLSFVTHLRYNELDRLCLCSHRLFHAASA
jgi:hypothetical protein